MACYFDPLLLVSKEGTCPQVKVSKKNLPHEVELQMLQIANTMKLKKSQTPNKTAKGPNHRKACSGITQPWKSLANDRLIAGWICSATDPTNFLGPDGRSSMHLNAQAHDGRLLSDGQLPSVFQNMDAYDDIPYQHVPTTTTSSLCTSNQLTRVLIFQVS